MPRRNASSSSLSRSPPSHLHLAPVTGLTPLSDSHGSAQDGHGHTISDVFRAGQARRTASSASIAAMNSEANMLSRKSRPPFLHFKQHSSGGASSDSSNDGVSSPLPSPALLNSAGPSTRMWTSAQALKEGRRPSFVYEAMPDTPSKAEIHRNSSESDVRSAGASARRKRLFHFPNLDD